VDGLRLDAVPYLYEEDGTNCENLAQTHAFLKKLRAHVDARFEDRMLLAEANQWPEDAAAYFGDGDECHMNFHFPIMPRMFMAMHMEDRFPLIDILAQTPQLHPSCQWAMFLRNHDELTLEMVTDEERDYMYRAYANEAAMRINLGIRRRLAPLAGNDRRKMELLNGLLFSLPGTPVLYYADEIGMGDNVFLGDRNGVRTPMQWSADRNAGFSRANPQRLILPIIIDPEYHYESLNVEAQQNNGNSLLWWTKRLIALRKQFRAFGRGTIEFLAPSNPHVLAFVREFDKERILVVANLSRFVQFVELDLGKYRSMVPIELFGRTQFPPIADHSYLLTLGGHAFYWFSLQPQENHEQLLRASLFEPPTVECTDLATLCSGSERARLQAILPDFFATRRWYRGRHRTLASMRVVGAVPIAPADAGPIMCFVRCEYTSGEGEVYVLALAFIADVAQVKLKEPLSVLAALKTQNGDGRLVDALEEGGSSYPLIEAILAKRRFRAGGGEVVATSTLNEEDTRPLGDAYTISATH
ncbi:MAG TPA: alpha-glucosidase C-terminal domain-containing protein, partial [Polyangiales bacterium]